MYKLGSNRKTPDVSPNLKNFLKLSTIVHSPSDWCNWIPKELKLDVISLLIFGSFPCNKGGKEQKKTQSKTQNKKKRKRWKQWKTHSVFSSTFQLATSRIIHSRKLRKWNSLQIICTTKALSYWTFLQWPSLSCSQTAFQEFWALKANTTKFTCPCHFYHMWTHTHTHSQRNVKKPEDTKGCSFSIPLTALCLFKPVQI